MPDTSRLLTTAESLVPQALERLETYVRHETPTGDAAALNALADVLEARHAELGASTSRVAAETGDHLVSTWGEGTGHVLLVGHHDTVWPVGQLERMPLTCEDGVLRGPGVFDMKGGLVVAEMALETLQRCGLAPARPVRFVIVADEEVGSPTARPVVEEQMAGARAVLGLESPHPKGGLKTSRLGSTRLRIAVRGKEAHAALDAKSGISAVDELVDQLLAVREVIAEEPTVLCNVGTLAGGGRTNVIPAVAHADVGLRFVDGETEARVLERLQALTPVRPGAEVDVQVITSRPAWPARDHGELWEAVTAAAAAVGQRLDGGHAAGAADTNVAGAAGLPTLDGFGPLGRGAHAVDEQIVGASLAPRAALLASVLLHM